MDQVPGQKTIYNSYQKTIEIPGGRLIPCKNTKASEVAGDVQHRWYATNSSIELHAMPVAETERPRSTSTVNKYHTLR